MSPYPKYAMISRSLAIPAGILRSSFFDPDVPTFKNFGSIGAVIGHEMTHCFDDQGRQFDKWGNLRDWWTQKTLDGFTERAKCFIKEYGSIEDKSTDMKVTRLYAKDSLYLM